MPEALLKNVSVLLRYGLLGFSEGLSTNNLGVYRQFEKVRQQPPKADHKNDGADAPQQPLG